MGGPLTNVDNARRLARRRLPRSVYRFVEGGTDAEVTARDNVAAFAEIGFAPRAGIETSDRQLARRVLGCDLSMPVVIAPAGMIRLAHRDGEVGVARAAGRAGIAMGVSTLSSQPIEDIVAASGGPVWWQVYFAGGREGAAIAIERARDAGCRAVLLTMDLAAPASREVDLRGGRVPTRVDARTAFAYAPEMVTRPAWVRDFLRDGLRIDTPNVQTERGGPPLSVGAASQSMYAETPTWDDLAWVKERFGGPVAVKGVLSAADARRAVDHGADAVIVSNHGGNALDGSPATLRVLPEIVAAVGEHTEVLMDGGVRRGADVVKALALGARAVLIGRAYVWALAARGEPGVGEILESFRAGIDRTLGLLGCTGVDDLDPSFLRLPAQS